MSLLSRFLTVLRTCVRCISSSWSARRIFVLTCACSGRIDTPHTRTHARTPPPRTHAHVRFPSLRPPRRRLRIPGVGGLRRRPGAAGAHRAQPAAAAGQPQVPPPPGPPGSRAHPEPAGGAVPGCPGVSACRGLPPAAGYVRPGGGGGRLWHPHRRFPGLVRASFYFSPHVKLEFATCTSSRQQTKNNFGRTKTCCASRNVLVAFLR